MIIRKPTLASRTVAVLGAVTALTFPVFSQAVGIGNITLQSRLGEPLRAQINLTAGDGEQIDDSCLSLLPPDQNGDRSGYLLSADLSFKTDGKRQYISIVSRKPLNDVFARLRLQVNCPGMGSIIRTFTVLPDLDSPALQVQPPIAVPDAPAPAAPPPPKPTEARAVAPVAAPQQKAQTPTQIKQRSSSSLAAKKRAHSSAPGYSRKSKQPGIFKLKLSGDPIDESRIGKISPEERAALLAQQHLLDADDQMASFLALQHQVKLLQNELGEIKLQLAQLGPPPVIGAEAAASSPQPSPTADENSTQTKPKAPIVAAATRPPTQPDDLYLQNSLFAAVGLLAILALWQGLRYYSKIKSRSNISPALTASPILDLPAEKVILPVPPPVAATAAPASALITEMPPASGELISVPLQDEEAGEENAMMEEARLYVAHGRPVKSIEILQDLINLYPAKAEAWSLLLSIYSSLGKTVEFGELARRFHKTHKNSPAWGGIQALGRTLDPDDPLYADTQGAAARLLAAGVAGSRKQIGDILMEMGALSRQDLQNCLDDYDPKKHGRFGGYLVARKAITLAQLDHALLHQQGITAGGQAGELPSLQDMENLLADFDPKRDGSVGKFIASRDAEVTEQLSHLLQHPTHAEEPQQANEKPLFEKHEMLDFVLESSAEHPVLDLEFEASTGKDEPLDFEVTPSSPPSQNHATPPEETLAFPEIQLNFGSDELSGEEAGKK